MTCRSEACLRHWPAGVHCGHGHHGSHSPQGGGVASFANRRNHVRHTLHHARSASGPLPHVRTGELGTLSSCVLTFTLPHVRTSEVKRSHIFLHTYNRRSSEIQGTALGKSLRAWTCIYRSMPAGAVQSRHAFVGGTVSTWGR